MVKSSNLEVLKEMFSKATEKAFSENIDCFVIETGRYNIQGTNKTYEVVCGRDENKDFFVACTCFGGLHEKPCYHGARALHLHIELKEQEIAEAKRQAQDKAFYQKTQLNEPSEKIGGFRV